MVRGRHPELPVVVVGHSHGGLIVLRYALASPEGLPGMVVNSPFLAIHPSVRPSAVKAWAARIFVHLVPGLLQPSMVDPSGVSRDPAVVDAYKNDPLVSRTLSLGWYRALLEAQADVMARAALLRVPTLIMASGADRLVDVEATRRFVAGAPAELVEFVEWKGLYHESFNEPEKEQVFGRMESWLETRRLRGGAGVSSAHHAI